MGLLFCASHTHSFCPRSVASCFMLDPPFCPAFVLFFASSLPSTFFGPVLRLLFVKLTSVGRSRITDGLKGRVWRKDVHEDNGAQLFRQISLSWFFQKQFCTNKWLKRKMYNYLGNHNILLFWPSKYLNIQKIIKVKEGWVRGNSEWHMGSTNIPLCRPTTNHAHLLRKMNIIDKYPFNCYLLDTGPWHDRNKEVNIIEKHPSGSMLELEILFSCWCSSGEALVLRIILSWKKRLSQKSQYQVS